MESPRVFSNKYFINWKFLRCTKWFIFFGLVFCVSLVNGESIDTIQLELKQDVSDLDQWGIFWYGESGYMYGLQDSPDLVNWSWVDLQYSQENVLIEENFSKIQDSYFFRLKYTDEKSEPLFIGDFDGDGLNNYFEITHSLTMGLSPLDSDSNGNGVIDGLEDTDGDEMLDGDEATYGLNPLVNDAMLDLDGDGLVNKNELSFNNNPLKKDHPALKLQLY